VSVCNEFEIPIVASDSFFDGTLELPPCKLLVLAGFRRMVPAAVLHRFSCKVINTHPSLLPRHAGKIGFQVQEAVVRDRDTRCGFTVHWVTENLDAGPIIFQKYIRRPETLTAWQLGGLIHNLECLYLPLVVNEVLNDRHS
jgi:phosphoribosylglycinamide formyltransferase-1